MAATVGAVTFIYFTLETQKSRSTAVHECMLAATLETQYLEDGRQAVTKEPIPTVYDKCLTDKGLK